MNNKYFPEEAISENDLYFVCYMIERVARKIHQRNKYVVEALGWENLWHLLSVAGVLHSENPTKVEQDWINDYQLNEGNFDISDINKELATIIPSEIQMGRVYKRLILNTKTQDEDYAHAILRIYTDPICETIDNYNCSAFYEPSYVQARAYFNGQF